MPEIHTSNKNYTTHSLVFLSYLLLICVKFLKVSVLRPTSGKPLWTTTSQNKENFYTGWNTALTET